MNNVETLLPRVSPTRNVWCKRKKIGRINAVEARRLYNPRIKTSDSLFSDAAKVEQHGCLARSRDNKARDVKENIGRRARRGWDSTFRSDWESRGGRSTISISIPERERGVWLFDAGFVVGTLYWSRPGHGPNIHLVLRDNRVLELTYFLLWLHAHGVTKILVGNAVRVWPTYICQLILLWKFCYIQAILLDFSHLNRVELAACFSERFFFSIIFDVTFATIFFL